MGKKYGPDSVSREARKRLREYRAQRSEVKKQYRLTKLCLEANYAEQMRQLKAEYDEKIEELELLIEEAR